MEKHLYTSDNSGSLITLCVSKPRRARPSARDLLLTEFENHQIFEAFESVQKYRDNNISSVKEIVEAEVAIEETRQMMNYSHKLNSFRDWDCSTISSESSLPSPKGKPSVVCIFDLDDTLIPTDWIRNCYSMKRAMGQGGWETYKLIRKELDYRTKGALVPAICALLRSAIDQVSHVPLYDENFQATAFAPSRDPSEWASSNQAKEDVVVQGTVAVVTNARSVGWLKTFEIMFPEIVKLLHNEGIPILRTSPAGTQPDIASPDYFPYWMNAKKIRFAEVVHHHRCQNPGNNTIDFVSIGDNDFEERAAMSLTADAVHKVRLGKIVKCKAGLDPENFYRQLMSLKTVLTSVNDSHYPHEWCDLNGFIKWRSLSPDTMVSNKSCIMKGNNLRKSPAKGLLLCDSNKSIDSVPMQIPQLTGCDIS